MDTPNPYVPELIALAAKAGISAVHLAQAFAEPEHFAAHLDVDELAKLRASCTIPAVRRPDPMRAMMAV